MRKVFSVWVWLLAALVVHGQEAPEVGALDFASAQMRLSWEAGTSTMYRIDRCLSSGTPWFSQTHVIPADTNAAYRDCFVTEESATAFYRLASVTDKLPRGEELVTYLPATAGGRIAVKILTPFQPRYPALQAGVLVCVSGFLGDERGFQTGNSVTQIGLIQVTYLWPGNADPTGFESDGASDSGGPDSISALRDVVLFASGQTPNCDGRFIEDLIQVRPVSGNVGVLALSHAGIAAVNLLYEYGETLTNLAYYVGWENPTDDATVCCDLGNRNAFVPLNPEYRYPDDYHHTNIQISYETVRWESRPGFVGFPYFDLNTNDVFDPAVDYCPSESGWTMNGKRYYSRGVLHALTNRLASGDWPEGLGTPDEADVLWAYRSSPPKLADVGAKMPNLKVMLLLARNDHVQSAIDKPHIHQLWHGFRESGGLWTRLNPDRAYLLDAIPSPPAIPPPDNPANLAPPDDEWHTIASWAYANNDFPAPAPFHAGVAEMADRALFDDWSTNLPATLVTYPPP